MPENQPFPCQKWLEGDIPVLQLPTDYDRSPGLAYRCSLCSLTLPDVLSDFLKVFSQREKVSPFVVVLAVFKILLHRLTLQDDILIGSTVVDHSRREGEEVTGVSAGTLALRTNLSGRPPFKKLLAQIQEMTLEAYTHQDMPTEMLAEGLLPGTDHNRMPAFQVMLNMVSLPHDRMKLAWKDLDMVSSNNAELRFDASLCIIPKDDVIRLDLMYNKTLFKKTRMQEILRQMKFLLEQVADDPDKSIDEYCLRTPQSAAILPDPGVVLSDRDYPLVLTMLLEHAKRSPAKPAVSQSGKIWTYSQLADSALRLAHTLGRAGIEKGDVIAVTGPRSFGIVVAAAAVFLRGGVLLLLDQNLPAGRKRLMCDEAKAALLVHVDWRKDSDHCPLEHNPMQVLAVEPDSGLAVGDEITGRPLGVDLPDLTSEDTAYVFFTSGTTGTPKGVWGSHKGLSHFLVWQRDRFAVGSGDRCAQLTGFSFDVVLRDIFLPLISGATLCLPDKSESLRTTRALIWLQDEGITLLHVVPSVALSWLGSVPSGINLQSLRVVFFAGEPLREALLRQWYDIFTDTPRIVNLYGPTESTLAKCYHELQPGSIDGVQPIGRPLPDSQAILFSKGGQLCGIGEIGEIVLRTPFRMLGYSNAAIDYNSPFVKNPYRDNPNDCLYFTGDLGRYHPDGKLEILGRLDDQIKIRGVRIEPEEVMTALERHDQVDSAFVLAKKDNRGEKILAAFIVPTGKAEIAVSKLRTKLQQQLPEYMIPSRFIVLNSLPLNPNGKIDREVLTELLSRRTGPQDISVGPRTPIERILADIWCEVLGLSQVDIHDTFMELGGHSLLATRIISQVWEKLNVKMSLKTIFEQSTIADLGQELLHAADDPNKLEMMAEVLFAIPELSEEEATAMLAAELKHN